jgi:hypothetical protein
MYPSPKQKKVHRSAVTCHRRHSSPRRRKQLSENIRQQPPSGRQDFVQSCMRRQAQVRGGDGLDGALGSGSCEEDPSLVPACRSHSTQFDNSGKEANEDSTRSPWHVDPSTHSSTKGEKEIETPLNSWLAIP